MNNTLSSISVSKNTFLTDAFKYIQPLYSSSSFYAATRELAVYLNSDDSSDRIYLRFTTQIFSHPNYHTFDLTPRSDTDYSLSAWSTHPSIQSHGYMFHLYEVYSYGPFHVYVASPTRIDIHIATDSPHWPIFSIHPYTLLAIQLVIQSTQYEIPVTFAQSQLRYQPNTLGTYIRPLLQCLLNPMILVPEVITTSRNILAPPLVRPTPTFYTVRAHHVTTVMTYLRQSLNLKRSQSSAFENLFTGQIDIQPLWTRQGFYESYFKIILSYSNFYQCIQQYQDSPLIEATFFELRPLLKFIPEIRNAIIDDLIRSSTSCSCHRSMFSQSAIACDKIFFSPPCFHPHSSPPTDVVIHGIIATHSAKSSHPRRFPLSETDHVASVCTFSLKHYLPPDEASFPCYHDRSVLSTRPNPVSALSKTIHNRPFPPLCNPQLRMFL
jgi:hypothetical protein